MRVDAGQHFGTHGQVHESARSSGTGVAQLLADAGETASDGGVDHRGVPHCVDVSHVVGGGLFKSLCFCCILYIFHGETPVAHVHEEFQVVRSQWVLASYATSFVEQGLVSLPDLEGAIVA